MPYATLGDLLTRYRPISSMVGSGDYDISSAEVNSVYVHQTEAYIDAFLGRRYTVPFQAPVSPLITQITADLSIFFILAERLPSVPDFMDSRRQRADALLNQLASGEIVISSATTVTSAGENFAWSPNMGHTPIFSPVLRDLDQLVDPDRVIHEQVARGGAPRTWRP